MADSTFKPTKREVAQAQFYASQCERTTLNYNPSRSLTALANHYSRQAFRLSAEVAARNQERTK